MVAASVLGELVASLSLHCPCFTRVERTQYENACESDPWGSACPPEEEAWHPGHVPPLARASLGKSGHIAPSS